MKIGGLQPVTASDFPGRMAAIVFTQGCNFHCPFCHNSSLLPMESESLIQENEIFDFLQRRRNLLEGVVISGGEPCLQDDLAGFCRRVKGMGFDVKIDTNGSRPEVIEGLLAENLVDFIAMDIKAPLTRLRKLTGRSSHGPQISRSISLIAESPHIVQPFVAKNAMSASLRE
jgi:pyruvate formate lyase activating enzyme